MAGKPPSKQKGNETVGATGEGKNAGVGASAEAENGTAAAGTGDDEVKLVNRLAESKSPYVSMSCILLSFLLVFSSFSFSWSSMRQ